MDINKTSPTLEHTAVRVALWRALHLLVDTPPYVFEDSIGEKLVNEKDWLKRQDMEINFSKSMRASVVGRARFIEDILLANVKKNITQYVILGAGLDTFAQRHPELGSHLHVFEVDQPSPQAYKQKRLSELGYTSPSWLHFVPVDFEKGESWWDQLIQTGFDPDQPTFVVSTGVSMYLTKDTNVKTFLQLSKLAPGSIFATTFMLALDLLDPKERSIMEFVMKKAKESETPFLSLFHPDEIKKLALDAGFKKVEYSSGEDIYKLYFSQRKDQLNGGQAEAFLVAKT